MQENEGKKGQGQKDLSAEQENQQVGKNILPQKCGAASFVSLFANGSKPGLTSKDFCYTQEEEDKKQENQGVRGVGEGGLAGYGSVHHQNRAIAARDYVLRP